MFHPCVSRSKGPDYLTRSRRGLHRFNPRVQLHGITLAADDDAGAAPGILQIDAARLVRDVAALSHCADEVIREDPPRTVVGSINDFVTGLHLQHFRHWLLRALYFIGGMAGCVCIATGFIFFVEKRKRQHAKQGIGGARWVDALAVTTVTGMVVATLTMLVANRLLPLELAERGLWQERIFWAAWLAALVHAVWRTSPVLQARFAPAWSEQSWAVAMLAGAAVLSNWLTTGDHLLSTLARGYWPVAGVDIMLLSIAATAGIVGRRLYLRARSVEVATACSDRLNSSERAAETAHV